MRWRLRTVMTALGIPVALVAPPLAFARFDALSSGWWAKPARLVEAHATYATLLRRDALAAVARTAPTSPGVHVVATDTTTKAREMTAALTSAADSLAPIIGRSQFVGAAVFGVSGDAWLQREQSRAGLRTRHLGVRLPRRDGEPCVTLVDPINWQPGAVDDPRRPSRIRAWAVDRLASSPCLLLGRFGLPSAAIGRDLDAQRWSTAMRGDFWQAGRSRVVESAQLATIEAQLSDAVLTRESANSLLACAEGNAVECARRIDALARPGDPKGYFASAFLWGYPLDRSEPSQGQLSGTIRTMQLRVPLLRPDGTVSRDAVADGPPLARLVADMAHVLGPERFAQVWRTDQPLAAAYATVTGEPFPQYVMRWLNAPTTPRRALRGAQMPWSDALWVVAMVGAMLAECVRRASRREAR